MIGLGWQGLVITRPDGVEEAHTVPVNDIGCHLLLSGDCPCRPRPDEDVPNVWSHTAFDTREDYENGRKMH